MMLYKSLHRYRLTLYPVNPLPICVFLPNNFMWVSLFLDSLGGSSIPGSCSCSQKRGPVAGCRKYGCAGMSCFLYYYPMAGPSLRLFLCLSLSSINNLNPVPRMEQCHFQRWEDSEHLVFCLSTESKQLKCFKRSLIRKLHKSNRGSISWGTIYYRNSEGFLELHWP